MKKLMKIFNSRVGLVSVIILVQLAVIIYWVLDAGRYFLYYEVFCTVLSFICVLVILNRRTNPGYKIAWILPILTLPVLGWLMYFMFGGNKTSRRTRKKMMQIRRRTTEALPPHPEVLEQLRQLDESAARQAQYIQNYGAGPPCLHTHTHFFPSGETMFTRMLEDLSTARHFIFMEYFIIQEGEMWNAILDILIKKAREGVDVRLIYDDVGCINTLPYEYDRTLQAAGIQCCPFNPYIPIVSARLNNRDHRKICVIDGGIGYTGGINLADEYINAYERFGHWKDTAVRLHGEAVWNLTVMFLSLWDYLRDIKEDYASYRPGIYTPFPADSDGFVQPYCDSPLDNEPVGQRVYLNMVHRARRYIYICTPYLIPDNEMITALCLAAQSGVDVRIMTPHIPDKKYAFAVTQANYSELADSGVAIYEYTPGFVHAKVMVVDDEYATIGTVNLDYRSLYLHYECGVWMYRSRAVLQARDDFLATLESCTPVTAEDCRNWPLMKRLTGAVMKIFAPLM